MYDLSNTLATWCMTRHLAVRLSSRSASSTTPLFVEVGLWDIIIIICLVELGPVLINRLGVLRC